MVCSGTVKKSLTLSFVCLFLGDTCLYLPLDDGLGCTHLLPVSDGLYAVCLEEVYQTPAVVSLCGKLTNWARHSVL